MSVSGKTIKLLTDKQEIIIEHIDEYVCGFAFIYCRLLDGSTISFNRDNIHAAYRRLPTGDYRAIHLKKVKSHDSQLPLA
jgi:hypothetical protein